MSKLIINMADEQGELLETCRIPLPADMPAAKVARELRKIIERAVDVEDDDDPSDLND